MTSTQARTRPGAFGIGTSSTNGGTNKGFGSGFGNGSAAWNGGIWSGNSIGSGMKSGGQDSGRGQNDLQQPALDDPEIITGSRSLLSSSESDGFNHRHGSWKSIDDTSPSLSRVHTNTSAASPIRRQNSNQLIPPSYADNNPTNATYFSPTPGSTTISSRSSQKNFLDPTSGNFVSGAFESNKSDRTSRHNSDEQSRFAARKQAFEGSDIGLGMQSARPSFNNNVSGYNSSAASRSGSIPPSRSDVDTLTRHPAELPSSQTFRYNTSAPHRGNLSAQAPTYSMPTRAPGQQYADRLSPSQVNQTLGDLHIGKENRAPYSNQSEASYGTSPHFGGGYPPELMTDSHELWNREEHVYQDLQDQFSSTGSGSGSLAANQATRRSMGYGAPYAQSPNITNTRPSQNKPSYPSAGNSSTYQQRAPSRGGFNGALIPGQAAALDSRLRGLQEQQQAYMLPRLSPIQYNNQYQFPSAYDLHSQPGFRVNQLNPYYQMPPVNQQIAAPHIPRGPASDHAAVQPVRSALLEEFRNNSKTNKKYELKDIYNYIVEFSGDQHGSRFIQQKLETANSDEKDQVFRELHPNAIQLMTDVFGNYVIQKFFEHGNQSQKKILANQMRTHILTLSTQMYGCRVVQKALEHILTDQQAQLVKELEHNVLRCVKDQNGNHVVQKAIERVPAEYIQFILNSFTGQVHSLATDQYGCRVIQRMLEHCEEHTQAAVLQEIHAAASSLILDQYGNYVAQHIIEHGKEEDRTKLVNLVISQITNFSKHKFASNVVEKSIQHGSEEARKRIITTLTVVNEKGESPSQSLIRDQYGNYVIQKVLNQLTGPEREDFVELIKAQLALLKRFAYGKQIAAIEKLIYTTPYPQHSSHTGLQPPTINTSAAPTPPLLTDTAQSPQSSSLPSTRADSYNGPNDSRKSSGSNAVGVMTPTST